MKWIMDMEIEEHCCIDERQLINSHLYSKDGERFTKGFIPWITSSQLIVEVPITEVRIVPDRLVNVMSLSKIMKKGMKVIFKNDLCVIERDGKEIIKGKRVNGAYEIETGEVQEKTEHKCVSDLVDPTSVYNTLEPEIGVVMQDNNDFECITCEPVDQQDIDKLSTKEQILWKRAMMDEMDSMTRNQVLEEQAPLPHDKVIGSRWTYSVKFSDTGQISKIKARLVAMGCHQREGKDYGETYAPVVSHATIRMLSLVASLDLCISHCDVTAAFLYGNLDERLFMRDPYSPHNKGKTYLLKKAIYGLKQAAFCWHARIEASLQKLGYQNNCIDNCLLRNLMDNTNSFILIHVDDLLLVSEDQKEISRCVEELSKEYLIKHLGEARKYLGFNVEFLRDKKYLYIHQVPMIKQLLVEYGMEDCHPTFTPMISDYLKGQVSQDSLKLPNNHLYQKAIGSLLYLGMISRPDIHLAVNILSRCTASPSCSDWEGIKRVMRYLKTTMEYRLRLGGEDNLSLITFCDADWGGEIQTRRSTSGQLIFLGSGLVEWKARKQNCVSLSTAEAEFIAAAEAVQTLSWMKELIKGLNISENLPLIVYTDNQSCLKMAESRKLTKRTKHIDVKYHFIKELVEKDVIKMLYCPTDSMPAYIMTKPLARPQHEKFVDMLGLIML